MTALNGRPFTDSESAAQLTPTASLDNSLGDSFVDQLRSMLDVTTFNELASRALETIAEPSMLAECAHLVAEREHGGLFYQARFLHKAFLIRELNQSAEIDFFRILEAHRLSRRDARKLAAFGRQLEEATDNAEKRTLQFAPNTVLNLAARQNGRTGEYIRHIAEFLDQNPSASTTQIHSKWCSAHGGIKANLDIIKPSDWWAFSHPKWRKDPDFDGSIPGEIYANALYYFAPRKGIAVDVMAGSGMLKRVYDDRAIWQKDSNFDLDIQLFDLRPRRKFIKKHDARYRLPYPVDWIFLDPPYFGQSSHLFESALSETQDPDAYLGLMGNVLEAMASSLKAGGRLCVLLPKWSGQTPSDVNVDVPRLVTDRAEMYGLTWIDTAYISRARQQEPGSALKNIAAKAVRRMRSDCCVLNVFEKKG